MTDVTNASRTNLLDIHTLQWHDELLEAFGVRRGMLAEVRSSAEELGRVASGPLQGVPITGQCSVYHHLLLLLLTRVINQQHRMVSRAVTWHAHTAPERVLLKCGQRSASELGRRP